MRAAETLFSEHRLIEPVQAAVETGYWRLAQNPTFIPEFFITDTDLILGLGAGCQQEK
jgi:hypothetical protein